MLARKALAGTAGAPKEYVEDVFSTYLTVGNGTTTTITNNIDLSGKGGLVWLKDRTGAGWHSLGDTERSGKRLFSNDTSAESSSYPFSFTSSGFTANGNLLDSGRNFVSWTFRKAKKFFDVVTYTGDGNTSKTISHNLGSTPGCIIVKFLNAGAWNVYHTSIGNTKYLSLNTTAAEATNSNRWNNTSPTSTEFTVGSQLNQSSEPYVAYLFAHDAGGFGDAGSDSVIKCDTFTTDGSGNSPTVNLGWEPQWLLVKQSGASGSWYIIDTMREWNNAPSGSTSALTLYPNLSNAEAGAAYWNPTSTGFYLGSVGSANTAFIYIAIRRGPMKTPTSGTSVFTPVAYTGNGTARTTVTDIVTDLSIIKKRNTTYAPSLEDRLRGANQVLESNSTGAEIATSQYILGFDVQNGVRIGTDVGVNESSSTFINWAFRRAPGFFDVVCWTGTGSNIDVTHNLGVTPEFIIGKQRDYSGGWIVYHKDIGSTGGYPNYMVLNSTQASGSGASTIWRGVSSTTFSYGTNSTLNINGINNVAYLFASVSGVSKVGSYTGNGSSVTVTTDFQPRFIMVKRTDSTGNWIVSDSARGLVSGSDPYLLLNSNAAEDTDEDWVDVSSTGFTVNETSAANANVNTGTYIYLAIA
jgi:hypothetical protein